MGNKPVIYALSGNVGSGKTTLGKALSEHFGGIPHLSSDGIREELTGGPNGGGQGAKDVFKVMRQRMAGHLAAGSHVVIDSTAMSPQYRQILDDYGTQFPMHKIQLHCDPEVWKQREGMRSDRWNLDQSGNKVPFEMPERAYKDSSKVQADIKPDIRIDTSHMKPEEVFDTTIDHIKNNPKSML